MNIGVVPLEENLSLPFAIYFVLLKMCAILPCCALFFPSTPVSRRRPKTQAFPFFG